MGPAPTVDGDLPMVEVFEPDAGPEVPSSSAGRPGSTDAPVRRARGRAFVAAALCGAVVVLVSVAVWGDEQTDDFAGRSDDPVVAVSAAPGDPFADDPVFDGAVRFSIGVAGETCCDRPAAMVVGGVSRVLAGRTRSFAADVGGIPGADVFGGADGAQLVALAVGNVTVVVAAEATRPFTPAELVTLRDHISVATDGAGTARPVAVAPLVAVGPNDPTGTASTPFPERVTPTVLTDESTLVAGGADSGTVVAVDRWTGRLLWASTVGNAAFVEAVLGDVIVIGTGPGRVVVLDVFTGVPRWTQIPGESAPS